jgi:hypothetical protein
MSAKVYASFREAAAFAKKSAIANNCTFTVARSGAGWIVQAPPQSSTTDEYVSFTEYEDAVGMSEQERLEAYEQQELRSESIG